MWGLLNREEWTVYNKNKINTHDQILGSQQYAQYIFF